MNNHSAATLQKASIKIANAYRKCTANMYINSYWDEYEKITSASPLSSRAIRKIEQVVNQTGGDFRMIDIYQFDTKPTAN